MPLSPCSPRSECKDASAALLPNPTEDYCTVALAVDADNDTVLSFFAIVDQVDAGDHTSPAKPGTPTKSSSMPRPYKSIWVYDDTDRVNVRLYNEHGKRPLKVGDKLILLHVFAKSTAGRFVSAVAGSKIIVNSQVAAEKAVFAEILAAAKAPAEAAAPAQEPGEDGEVNE